MEGVYIYESVHEPKQKAALYFYVDISFNSSQDGSQIA